MVQRADVSPISRLMQRVDAVADGAPPFDTISTGFPSLDQLLGGGIRHGDLIVLGGDVGAGKSALALAITLRMKQRGESVGFLTAEMSPERVLERALAIEGRARIDDLRRGLLDDSARAALGAAALRLRDELPWVEPVPAGGAAELADALRRALDLDVAVIDSLQSLPAGAATQDEELAAAVRCLKAIALEAELAVIVTAHLPLLSRARPDRRPTLDDFGALGAVKQHADIVLALFREELYEPARANEGATELAVLKNRNGLTSYIDLFFYKQWLRFEDMVDGGGKRNAGNRDTDAEG